jgi:tetratricopeptide (TPR) repeat protein
MVKLYCIDEDLQSLDGLIAIYHKQNDFEKERECIERAISLASLNDRHEKHLSIYKHKLGKLLGIYKEKEVPPESHMNAVFDKINPKERGKTWDYFNKLIRKARAADNEFDYKTAVEIYERLIAEGYNGLYWTSMYDRLIAIYFNFKLYEDEVRVIELAINTFKTLKDGAIKALSHQYDKRLEQLEKRLVSAQKRLKSCNKESK